MLGVIEHYNLVEYIFVLEYETCLGILSTVCEVMTRALAVPK